MSTPTSPTGFINGVATAWNADFSGSTSPSINNGLVTDNEVWIGSTTPNANNSHVNVKTLTAGTGISFDTTTPGVFAINATGGSSITGIAGDSGGTATGPTVTIEGGVSGAVFTRSSNILTESFNFLKLPGAVDSTGVIISTFFGQDIPIFGLYEVDPNGGNMYVGGSPIHTAAEITGYQNIAVSVGQDALTNLTTGFENISISGLEALTTGNGNTACGNSTGVGLQFGNYNVFIGHHSGYNYSANESSNITILNDGEEGESNTTRIGVQGSSDKQQNRCFISGIVGVAPSNATPVTIDSMTGQLGVGTIGQTATSSVASGSAVSLTTTVAANITSISLSAGTWQISSLCQFSGTPTVTGAQQTSISITSATHGTLGDNSAQCVYSTTDFTLGNVALTVPGYILTIGSTTTVYMVASGVFGAGSMNAYGRISAIKLT